MSFIKATVIGVDFKELVHPPLTECIYAEVVLIDRSQTTTVPSIYCLNDDDFTTQSKNIQSRGFNPLTESAFTMMGSVDSIDKEKKIIRLKNPRAEELAGSFTIVSYKHLIVASDLNHNLLDPTSYEEFSEGLSALMDALKLQKNRPEQFLKLNNIKQVSSMDQKHHLSYHNQDGIDKKIIEQIVQSHITRKPHKNIPSDLASLYKRLYEVHLGN